MSFSYGDIVKIHGIKSRPQHNGHFAMVLKHKGDGKYKLKLQHGGDFDKNGAYVHGNNLTKCDQNTKLMQRHLRYEVMIWPGCDLSKYEMAAGIHSGRIR